MGITEYQIGKFNLEILIQNTEGTRDDTAYKELLVRLEAGQ